MGREPDINTPIKTKELNRVFLAVPRRVQVLDLTGPAQVFQEARELGAPLELIFLSMDSSARAETNTGLQMGGLSPFSRFQLGKGDLLIVPGVVAASLNGIRDVATRKPFYGWMVVQRHNGATLCAVCTGAYLVAQAGLLQDESCTTHWKYFEDFRKRFPRTRLLENRLFVESGDIYTSAGVSSGIDLSLYLIDLAFGPGMASRVAREILVYYRRGPDDAQINEFLKYRSHMDDIIHRTQDYVLQYLDRQLTIQELSEKAGMSARNLTRRFKNVTGLTIQEYTDELRLERARKMLSEGHKVHVVAASCGYRSANALRSLFRKKRGVLPSGLSQ